MQNAEQENVRPISPEELDSREHLIPEQVIAAVNTLLAKNYDQKTGKAQLRQSDIVFLAVSLGLKSTDIFNNCWLNFEDLYRRAGWVVKYDKPGYNESYEPVFYFERSSNK